MLHTPDLPKPKRSKHDETKGVICPYGKNRFIAMIRSPGVEMRRFSFCLPTKKPRISGAFCVVRLIAQVFSAPDRDSAIIMQDFFTNLAASQSKADALRNAQLKRSAARKDKFGAAPPFFWAAWTETCE